MFGTDFRAPLIVKCKRQSKRMLQKISVAISICFGTKAFHFGHISDLTSRALISALTLFSCEEGKMSLYFFRNGKNFDRVNFEFNKLYEQSRSKSWKLYDFRRCNLEIYSLKIHSQVSQILEKPISQTSRFGRVWTFVGIWSQII